MLQVRYETQRLLLVASTPKLAKNVLAYYTRNKDFFENRDPYRGAAFYTLAYQRRALAQDKRDAQDLVGARFWLLPKDGEEVIGLVALNGIMWGSFYSAYVAYKMDAQFLNRGLATEALRCLIQIGFQELKLHRLEADIMPDNAASLRVAEKLGFQNEGISKRFLNIRGEWQDHVRMSLLNE